MICFVLLVVLSHCTDSRLILRANSDNRNTLISFNCPANHFFHRQCGMRWLQHSRRCPICRERISLPPPSRRPIVIGFDCVFDAIINAISEIIGDRDLRPVAALCLYTTLFLMFISLPWTESHHPLYECFGNNSACNISLTTTTFVAPYPIGDHLPTPF